MDISHKGPYTILEQDDIRVTADIEIQETTYKSDVIEIHVFVPVLNEWIEVTTAQSYILANELIEKHVKESSQPPADADEYNYKIFA